MDKMDLFNIFSYGVTPHGILLFLSATLILGVTTIVFIRSINLVNLSLLLLVVTLSMYLYGFAFTSFAHDIIAARYWVTFGESGVIFIPPAVLFFITVYIGKFSQYRNYIIVCIILSTIFLIYNLTTNYFVEGLYIYSWGFYPRFSALLGLLFLLYFIFTATFYFVLLYIEKLNTKSEVRKNQVNILIIAFILAHISMIDFFPGFGIRIYPFGYIMMIIFMIVLFISQRYYQLFRLEPDTTCKAILKSLDDFIIVVDNTKAIKMVEGSENNFLGYYKDELINQPVDILLNPSDHFLQERLDAIIYNNYNELNEYDTQLINRNDALSYVSLKIIRIFNKKNIFIGTMLIIRDNSNRKQIELELKESNRLYHNQKEELEKQNYVLEKIQNFLKRQTERALEAEKMKTQFLTSVTHDLKTPLNSIMGFGNLLKSSLERKQYDSLDELIDMILLSGKQLYGLIENILTLAAIETGKEKINPVNIDIESLKMHIKEIRSHFVFNTSVEFESKIENSIQSFTSDDFKLKTIMRNILTNAFKYTYKGYVSVKLNVSDSKLVFEVTDTGIGIKKEMIDKIFEPFTRATNDEATFSGTGIGLTIVKNFTEMLGGKLEVESEIDKGSTFRVKIPINESQD